MDIFKVNSRNELEARDGIIMHLWRVMVTCPVFGTATYNVLAHNEEMAIGMARCAMGNPSYSVSEEWSSNIKAEAKNVPLIIEGWGKNHF